MTAIDFQSVHERFRPRVLRYLLRFVDRAEAEDLTQVVMLKLSEALPGFRGEASLDTWIYRIATNAALDRLRHRSVPTAGLVEFDADETAVPPAAQVQSVESAAVRDEMSACIREFIGRLPPGYKAVMVLSEIEGFTNAEIASILGVSLDTVKIRLHRARDKLRAELQAGCTFYRNDCEELACDRKPVAIKLPPRR